MKVFVDPDPIGKTLIIWKPISCEPREQPDGTYKVFRVDADPEYEIPFSIDDDHPVLNKSWLEQNAIRVALTEKQFWHGLNQREAEILNKLVAWKNHLTDTASFYCPYIPTHGIGPIPT